MSLLAAAAALTLAMAVTPPPQDIAAAGPQGPLKGTLIAGQAQAPLVLLIPGSGPTDRDGNSPLGVKAATYRLLAEGLATRGIGSVRIDKRGMFASAGAVPDANAVTIGDYVEDTRAWIAAARARTGASCIWLVGHSEGGLVALATAARDTRGICGLVLIATPGRRFGEVLRKQLHANPANAPLLPAADAAIDALAAGRRVDTATLPAPLLPLFAPAVQGFVISLAALDPMVMIAKVTLPILIVQGERDLQVSVADAQRLAAAQPAAKTVRLPDVNHVLKQVSSEERGPNIATYADPNLPLAPGVTDAIANFIAAQR